MRMCRIGDIAKVQSGFAFKSSEFKPDGVKLLRNTNILPQRIYWDDLACLDESQYERYSGYHLRPGDILLSLDRPVISTGIKVAQVGDEDVPSLLVQRVGRLCLEGSQVDPDYLYAFLRSPRFIREVSGHEQSLGVPHVSPSQVEAVELALPELTDQRRIAARLKAQLAEVETARQAAQVQLSEASALADAIVLDSVHAGDTQAFPLGDVLDEVKKGIGSSWADFPVLGATRDGLAPAKEQPGKHAPKYKPAFPGTVFYNPMRILIGSIAYVDEDDTPGITSPDYVALQGKAGLVDSRWFYFWLRSPLGVKCINALARGAVRERMLFNRLAEGEIALPPYPVQQAASRALAELRPMKACIEARLREIERLPQRLLAQVFDFEEVAADEQ